MMKIDRKTIHRPRPAPPAAQRARRSSINTRGLTLIEVVASLGIIAVGIVGILALFPTGLRQHKEAMDRTQGALIGEYACNHLRLFERQLSKGCTTAALLDAAGWGDYETDGITYTFDATTSLGAGESWGSANVAMQQPDLDHYELTIEVCKMIVSVNSAGTRIYNMAFDTPDGPSVVQVIITVRWPRARTDAERVKQSTMTFVTFIRPQGS